MTIQQLPTWLEIVKNNMKECMSADRRDAFIIEFDKAVPAGVDLNQVKAPFIIYILESTLNKVDQDKYPDIYKCVMDIIELYKSGGYNTSEKFEKAANATAAAYATAAANDSIPDYANAAAAYAAVADIDTGAAALVAYDATAYDTFAAKIIELIQNAK